MPAPHVQLEQDNTAPSNGNELPTYDDLAAQHGPNSRFGRWRSWIEKRAAERYNDITPQERLRRQERGWDLPDVPRPPPGLHENPLLIPAVTHQPPTPGPASGQFNLHIQTNSLNLSDGGHTISSPAPIPFVSQKILPSHLKLNHFGSRFLPHATSQVRCVLPLASEKLLLIGHDEGLSVLDLFPQEWNDTGGIDVKNPGEAQTRLIWEGEGVFQMTIIEQEEGGEGSLQGVVLALVGQEHGSPTFKDCDTTRSLRMYNLQSLINLAKWTISNKGANPLDLRRPSNWQAQSPPRRHRHQNSLALLKSLMETTSPVNSNLAESPVSYQNMLAPPKPNRSPNGRRTPSPTFAQNIANLMPRRRNTEEAGWDIVEDSPLRWATDFKPLASPGTRLAGCSVVSYAIWTDENRIGRGGQLLAVATRNNIFLYETPKRERAFRFVKEFYTPMQPRSITFFQQVVQEVTRSMSDVTGNRHKRNDSTNTLRYGNESSTLTTMDYGTQLSIFVIFDKKAGWIRIADSAVGELELPDDSYISALNQESSSSSSSHFLSPRDTLTSGANRVRARLSFEHASQPRWILPTCCEVPLPPNSTSRFSAPGTDPQTRKILILTRGRKTHIVPSPLPSNYTAYPSLAIITWKSPPRHIVPRVCEQGNKDETGDFDPVPFLQLVAFGEEGLEVQEMTLNFLTKGGGKGKGKATVEEIVRAQDDVIQNCGFMATGGHWDQVSRLVNPDGLARSSSTGSDVSSNSFDSVGTSVIMSRIKREEGVYGWWQKDVGDYRVFWVGGSANDNE